MVLHTFRDSSRNLSNSSAHKLARDLDEVWRRKRRREEDEWRKLGGRGPGKEGKGGRGVGEMRKMPHGTLLV